MVFGSGWSFRMEKNRQETPIVATMDSIWVALVSCVIIVKSVGIERRLFPM